MWALARLGQHVSADVLRLAIALLEIQRRQKLASYQGLIGIVLVTENHGVGGSIPPLGTIPLFSRVSFYRLGYAIARLSI